jgi:hypothetical protein
MTGVAIKTNAAEVIGVINGYISRIHDLTPFPPHTRGSALPAPGSTL